MISKLKFQAFHIKIKLRIKHLRRSETMLDMDNKRMTISFQ